MSPIFFTNVPTLKIDSEDKLTKEIISSLLYAGDQCIASIIEENVIQPDERDQVSNKVYYFDFKLTILFIDSTKL